MITDPRQVNIAKGYLDDFLALLALFVSRPEGVLVLAVLLFGNLGRAASRGYEVYAGLSAIILLGGLYALARIADRKKLGRKWTIFLFAVFMGIVCFWLGYELI